MNKRSFNLIDCPWIRVMGRTPVSLREVFADWRAGYELAGHPVEKLIVFRLLLAILERALLLRHQRDWRALTLESLSLAALSYLDRVHDAFDLYDSEKPFLQFPQLKGEKGLSVGATALDKANGNTTVLAETQRVLTLGDADISYILLQQVMFATGGKRSNQSVALDGVKKSRTAAFGSAVGAKGYLHAYMKGVNLAESLRLNLWTIDDIERSGAFPGGMGLPPWESMPTTESDAVAEAMRTTFIGRLIPMNRFCLIDGESIVLTEGVALPGLEVGAADPSVTITYADGKWKGLYATTDKSPWRQIEAMLAFLSGSEKRRWLCRQLQVCLPRENRSEMPLGVWCGGIALTNFCGQQYLSGSDDFVEFEFLTSSGRIDEGFYDDYVEELRGLEAVGRELFISVAGYWRTLSISSAEADRMAKRAVSRFWLEVEKWALTVMSAADEREREAMRRGVVDIEKRIYDEHCSGTSSRQLMAKVANRPKPVKNYLARKEAK